LADRWRLQHLLRPNRTFGNSVADNDTGEGRARNRRVVMQVLHNPGDVEVKGDRSPCPTPRIPIHPAAEGPARLFNECVIGARERSANSVAFLRPGFF
jgi:hypothetical protein